jgi:hypothetical protein
VNDLRTGKKIRRVYYYLPALLLLVFWWLAVATADAKTLTVDEQVHILRGVSLWQNGDLRFQGEHMPLSHWLNGLLLQGDPALPRLTDLPSWPSTNRLVMAPELFWTTTEIADVHRFLFLARFSILCSGMMLGALLLKWSRRMSRGWSEQQRLLMVWSTGVLFAFSPNLIAVTTVATTDGLTVVLFSAVLFTLWHYQQQPTTLRWILFSALTGLALATKLTNLVLLPVIFLLVLQDTGWRAWRRYLPRFLLLAGVGWFTHWVVYLFEWRRLQPNWPSLPAATYLNSIFRVGGHIDQGHYSFLLGERSIEGWWHYFGVATAVKLPTPVIILLLSAIGLLIYHYRRPLPGPRPAFLLLPALALFLLASGLRLNIGIRHIMPIWPLLWLLIVAQLPHFWTNRVGRVSLMILFAALIIGTLRQHPHHLAYFNSLVGGSSHGYRVLGDSNLDWGQDLNLLHDYLQEEGGLDTIFLSYYGAANPLAYGFPAQNLIDGQEIPADFKPANPAPGVYAISVSHLQGLGLQDPDLFDWFRYREPIAQFGYTINLYEVPEKELSWLGICMDPGPVLTVEQIDRFLGGVDGRRFFFDCNQSWVMPAEGGRGRYLLPQRDRNAQFVGTALGDHLHLVYRHHPGLFGPSFDVYEWHGPPSVLPNHGTALPPPFADTLQLTGYTVSGTDWWTSWEVVAASGEPLTLAGHLYVNGPPPEVADGLGFSADQWQPGDRFWQRFSFVTSGEYLETGLYNYVSGERLAPFVPLSPPEVEE